MKIGKILINLFLLVIINQNILSQSFPDSIRTAVLPSLKAGFHTSNSADYNDFGFPAGFIFDFSLELHTGKGWFLGLNYDYWKVRDEVSYYHLGKYKRNLTASDFSFTLKYRYFLKNAAISAGVGLGSSVYRDEIEYYGYDNEPASMFNVNARIGFDYFIPNKIILSFEASVYTMDEMKLSMGGGVSRSNSFFKFTAGIGYLLIIY